MPLFPEAERIEPLGPVHRQHAVEMVDFVLQQLRPVPLEVDLVPLALGGLVAHPDTIGS